MYDVPYGKTAKARNDLLLTIGNVYLIKDKDGNEIEATLVRCDVAIVDYVKFTIFVKGRLAKKQVTGYHYKAVDTMYDVKVDDIICEVENRARFEKEDLESTTENNTEKE